MSKARIHLSLILQRYKTKAVCFAQDRSCFNLKGMVSGNFNSVSDSGSLPCQGDADIFSGYYPARLD